MKHCCQCCETLWWLKSRSLYRGSHRGILLIIKQQQNFHKRQFHECIFTPTFPSEKYIFWTLWFFFFFYQYFGLIHCWFTRHQNNKLGGLRLWVAGFGISIRVLVCERLWSRRSNMGKAWSAHLDDLIHQTKFRTAANSSLDHLTTLLATGSHTQEPKRWTGHFRQSSQLKRKCELILKCDAEEKRGYNWILSESCTKLKLFLNLQSPCWVKLQK